MARSRSGTRGRRGPASRSAVRAAASRRSRSPSRATAAPSCCRRRSRSRARRGPGGQSADVIRELIKSGIFATINQLIDRDTASLVATELGSRRPSRGAGRRGGGRGRRGAGPRDQGHPVRDEDPTLLVPRAPIVTVMGHVDHGKTSLLDAIRSTAVARGSVAGSPSTSARRRSSRTDKKVVFLDTPGHEAFTANCGPGRQVTDIAIIVVAADDGVMPQTLEAIAHARAAKVPIIIALNKIDKPDANPDRSRPS